MVGEVKWLLVMALCLSGALVVEAELRGIDPYEELIVEIDPEIEECSTVIQQMKLILNRATNILAKATDDKLKFKKASFVIPEGMETQCGLGIPDEKWSRMPDVQRLTLSKDHPIFGANPWTQQSRGCGQPGDALYLPETFLVNNTLGTETKAKVLMHQWAKYRWGVFEEHGIDGDPTYPLEYGESYSTSDNKTLWSPNYCSDEPLVGNQTESDCQHPNCPFEFSKYQTATSSLLALPLLNSVDMFCSNATHNSDIPTKQNNLCNGRSIEDIYQMHEDFHHAIVHGSFQVETEYYILLNATARYVILVDETNVMSESSMKNRWTRLTSALKQWILEDVLESSEVGIVLFDYDYVSVKHELMEITDSTRKVIAESIPSSPRASYSPADISMALKHLSISMGLTDVTVILIVDPNTWYSSDTESAMISAAGSNIVWPLLFPVDSSTMSETSVDKLAMLADATGGKMLMVPDETFQGFSGTTQSVSVQKTFAQHMRRIQKETLYRTNEDTPVLVQEEQFSTDPAIFTVYLGSNVDRSRPITLLFYVSAQPSYVYVDGIHATTNYVTSNCYKATIDDPKKTSYEIRVGFTSTKDEAHLVEVLVMESLEGIRADLWSDHNLTYVDLTSPDSPVTLFVKVQKGDSPVVGADVRLRLESGGLSDTIQLRDNGGISDITGNDGIYSAYWTYAPNGAQSIYDLQLSVESTTDTFVLGEEEIEEGIICCGSSLNISAIPKVAANASFHLMLGRSYVTADVGKTDVFPPSKITDLKAVKNNDSITLVFTAPGDNLDKGVATEYLVLWRDNTVGDWSSVSSTNYSLVTGGSEAEVVFFPPKYDAMLEYVVKARDLYAQESQPSNSVRIALPTYTEPEPEPDPAPGPGPVSETCFTAGGVAGSFFGGLALGLIILVCFIFRVKILNFVKSKSKRPRSPPVIWSQRPPAGRTQTSPPETSGSASPRDTANPYTVDPTDGRGRGTILNRVESPRPPPPPAPQASNEETYSELKNDQIYSDVDESVTNKKRGHNNKGFERETKQARNPNLTGAEIYNWGGEEDEDIYEDPDNLSITGRNSVIPKKPTAPPMTTTFQLRKI